LDKAFRKRMSRKEYGKLELGFFDPYSISRKIQNQFFDIAQKLGVPNPFYGAMGVIAQIEAALSRLRTTKGTDFPSLRNPLKVEPVSALPKPEEVLKVSENRTPMPTNQLATANTMQVSPVTGLTVNQEALLSPDEQLIARRQNQKQGMTGTV
jgi:hypothetical protein